MQDPWIILGDFNNVLSFNDRIRGNTITTHEFVDLVDMMHSMELFEAATRGNFFTWSKKHATRTIYSRIDRAICNVKWFQT